MTKRTVHALALVLSATPLLLVGCGDSGNNNGTGGSGGGGGVGGTIKNDGGGGAGGAKLDVGVPDVVPPAVDTAPVIDVAVPIDTSPVVDAAIADAPISPDVPIVIDTGKLDAPAPNDLVMDDTTPAIDTTVVACTITPRFTGGPVNADLTLSKDCSPYAIAENITVNGNATLTIEAGATLSFDPDVGIWISYSTAAKLVAVGTAASPIVFTSTNTTPTAGDWSGIVLWGNTMGGTQIAYATLDYCGSSYSCIHGIGVKPNRVTVDHVAIGHVGPGADGIQEDNADSNFAISNSTFSNITATPTQQYAISVQAPSFAGIDSTNTFNGGAMIELAGGTVAVTTDWKTPGTTVAATSDLRVEGTTTPILTIPAGGTFKFASGTSFWIGYAGAGNLKVNGTQTSPVVFTSLNASPTAGDWEGITLWGAGRATIAYATISYGGLKNGDISVVSDTNVLDIQNSTLSNSGSYGIGIPCGSAATVTSTGNTFTGNASGNAGPGPTTGTVACP